MRFLHGWAFAAAGAVGAGLDEMRRGLAASKATMGPSSKCPTYLGLMAGAPGVWQRLRGTGSARRGIGTCQPNRTNAGFEAELIGSKVRLLLRRTRPNAPRKPRAAINKALSSRSKQGASFWELRAATSLARLWASRASAPRPTTCSRPSTAGSPRASTPPTLKDARALLDELA